MMSEAAAKWLSRQMRSTTRLQRLLLYTVWASVAMGIVVSLLSLSSSQEAEEDSFELEGLPHHAILNWSISRSSSPSVPTTQTMQPAQKAPRGIPRILHQTFKSSRVFFEYQEHIRGCLSRNPEWRYFLWRDEDSLEFIKDNFPQFLSKYRSYKTDLQRSDSIRYLVLYHYGGVYLDMDVSCIRPLFPTLYNMTAFLDQEAPEHAALLYGKETSPMNSVMGAVRGHPFFLAMLSAMMGVDSRWDVLSSTGPGILDRVYTEWRSGNLSGQHPVELLPYRVFSPKLDTGSHRFKIICIRYFRDRDLPGDARVKALKQRVCSEVMRPGWRDDRTSRESLGRHLFLHLGYGGKRRQPRFFEITDLIRDVMLYKIHKMNMTFS